MNLLELIRQLNTLTAFIPIPVVLYVLSRRSFWYNRKPLAVGFVFVSVSLIYGGIVAYLLAKGVNLYGYGDRFNVTLNISSLARNIGFTLIISHYVEIIRKKIEQEL